jgi:hypothetical protein
MLTAALLTKAKLWKQSRCPTKCGIDTPEFYSVIKKNKMMSSAGKWMELENINVK